MGSTGLDGFHSIYQGHLFCQRGTYLGGRNPASHETIANHCVVGIYRGSITPGFFRCCLRGFCPSTVWFFNSPTAESYGVSVRWFGAFGEGCVGFRKLPGLLGRWAYFAKRTNAGIYRSLGQSDGSGCRQRLEQFCPQLPFQRFDATDGRQAEPERMDLRFCLGGLLQTRGRIQKGKDPQKRGGSVDPRIVNPSLLIWGCSLPKVMNPQKTQGHPLLMNWGLINLGSTLGGLPYKSREGSQKGRGVPSNGGSSNNAGVLCSC